MNYQIAHHVLTQVALKEQNQVKKAGVKKSNKELADMYIKEAAAQFYKQAGPWGRFGQLLRRGAGAVGGKGGMRMMRNVQKSLSGLMGGAGHATRQVGKGMRGAGAGMMDGIRGIPEVAGSVVGGTPNGMRQMVAGLQPSGMPGAFRAGRGFGGAMREVGQFAGRNATPLLLGGLLAQNALGGQTPQPPPQPQVSGLRQFLGL